MEGRVGSEGGRLGVATALGRAEVGAAVVVAGAKWRSREMERARMAMGLRRIVEVMGR